MASQLREFQLAFGNHVRNPEQIPLPPGIPPERAKIVEELLFNNISGFVERCFPVCKTMLPATIWQHLKRDFYREWRCQSPLFNTIPQEFLHFLKQCALLPDLPPWFLDLAHYEWVELSLETQDDGAKPNNINTHGALYTNTTIRNLVYNWPVHTISRAQPNPNPQHTFLVVHRSPDFTIHFTEISAATSLLINMLQELPQTRLSLIKRLSHVLQCDNQQEFQHFANAMVDDLLQKNILFESVTP